MTSIKEISKGDKKLKGGYCPIKFFDTEDPDKAINEDTFREIDRRWEVIRSENICARCYLDSKKKVPMEGLQFCPNCNCPPVKKEV